MTIGNQLIRDTGAILMGLRSLELLLRLFLYNSNGPGDWNLHFEGLKEGQSVLETPLTDFRSLGKLIEDTNTTLKGLGASDEIDAFLVGLRDAFAHGRLLADRPEGPYRLFKFSKASGGTVKVTAAIDVTPDWANEQLKRIDAAIQKLVRLAQSRGYPTFPE